MKMLVEELQLLAADPWSWVVVGLLAVIAAHSAVMLIACPYVRNRATITDAEVDEAKSAGTAPGGRFLALMVGGITLTLAGLFMIAEGAAPKIALAALVAGIFLIQTEPVRLSIRQSKTRLISHRDADPGIVEGDRDRLKGGHWNLAGINLALVLALCAALLAF